ncbi:cellulase family glycosylhydrolase [Luedemannella helvata]|uniref:cellulase n=1 Tax=Luedemannella helvata TaxID=349315 RepID=A0ABP4X8M0_9ACTN
MRQRITRGALRRVGVVIGGLTSLLVGTAVLATNANAAAGCTVTYDVPSQWSGGFQANVNITNLGDPVNGWRLAWTFAAGQSVTQVWNATTTSSGAQVTATNVSYNAAIPTNGSASFGFLGSWTGSNPKPTSFSLNGVPCTGRVATSTPPTSRPATSAPPSSAPPSTRPPSSQPPTSAPPVNAMAAVAAMQPGWNVGNTLDAIPDETSWGNPAITKEMFDAVRAQGFNSVRIPVTWSNHQGPAPSYTIDPAYLGRVRQVVDWALADGLYVLLNVHHDSWQWMSSMPTDHDNVLARFKATWAQIAAALKDEPAKLTFESVNEPQFANVTDEQAAPLLDELNKAFYTTVRTSGGNNATRLLVLPALGSSPDQARMDALTGTLSALNDRNLIATVHYYGFWPFSVNIAGKTTFDADTKNDMVVAFDRMYNTFVSKEIPVILGEYGLLSYDYTRPGVIEAGEVKKFFEELGYQARTKKVTTMLWDAGSFLHRNTLQWRDPDLLAQITSSWTTRSGTASSDLVFLPKSGPITSRTLTLNLNGTTFQGLRQGNTALTPGTDYTVSGDRLTVTASALTRLAGSRAYGVNATVQAVFSQGVPWSVHVLTYDAPVLSSASGTTSGLTIPTQFRGDLLATMEARYADGSNAGTANWTPYQEFSGAFMPDYPANTITLKSDFLNTLTDGARVTLTFHFWSGTLVTYHVTRSGSTVTGTTG